MSLTGEGQSSNKGSTNSLTGDLLTAPGTSQGQGPATRSSSPSLLSGELFLRVHSQNELVESMEDMLTQITEPSDDVTSTEVTVMLNHLDSLHQAFLTEHSWLVSHWPPVHLDHAYFTRKVSLTESKLVLKIKRLLGRQMEQLTQPTQPTASVSGGSRTRSRLPELTVPSFSGESDKWPDFKAMFMSVIGNRTDLSDLEKFQYLKAAMKGDASDLIRNLTPDPSSYNVAWQLLNGRFENKRLMIKSRLERMLMLKPMTRRQSSSLTKMVNLINETTQALKTCTVESSNDCLMVTLLTGLLDQDSRERWESSLSSDEFPSLRQLVDFLMSRARTLESIEAAAHLKGAAGPSPRRIAAHQATQQHPASLVKPKTHHTHQTSQTHQPSSQPSRGAVYPCDCCSQDHFIVMCPRMRDYSLAQRAKIVKERSLCCNCLGRHNARNCNNPRHCKTCNANHHTMLHGVDFSSIFGPAKEHTQSSQDDQAASTTVAGPSSA